MLSLQDVIDYCDLDRREIEAIAEHEHVPVAVAAEISALLLSSPEGICRLHLMFVENMQAAIDAGNMSHAEELALAYRHLQRTYPLIVH